MVKNLRKIYEKLKTTTTPSDLTTLKTSLNSFLQKIENPKNSELQKKTINFLRLNLIDFCRLIFTKFSKNFKIYEFISKLSLILIKQGKKTIGQELLENGFRNLILKKNENFSYFLILGIICTNLGFCFLKNFNFKKAFFFTQFFNKNIRDFLEKKKFENFEKNFGKKNFEKNLFFLNKDLVYIFVISFIILAFSIFMNSKGKGKLIFEKIIDKCEKILKSHFKENNIYFKKMKYYIDFYKKKVFYFLQKKKNKKNEKIKEK